MLNVLIATTLFKVVICEQLYVVHMPKTIEHFLDSPSLSDHKTVAAEDISADSEELDNLPAHKEINTVISTDNGLPLTTSAQVSYLPGLLPNSYIFHRTYHGPLNSSHNRYESGVHPSHDYRLNGGYFPTTGVSGFPPLNSRSPPDVYLDNDDGLHGDSERLGDSSDFFRYSTTNKLEGFPYTSNTVHDATPHSLDKLVPHSYTSIHHGVSPYPSLDNHLPLPYTSIHHDVSPYPSLDNHLPLPYTSINHDVSPYPSLDKVVLLPYTSTNHDASPNPSLDKVVPLPYTSTDHDVSLNPSLDKVLPLPYTSTNHDVSPNPSLDKLVPLPYTSTNHDVFPLPSVDKILLLPYTSTNHDVLPYPSLDKLPPLPYTSLTHDDSSYSSDDNLLVSPYTSNNLPDDLLYLSPNNPFPYYTHLPYISTNQPEDKRLVSPYATGYLPGLSLHSSQGEPFTPTLPINKIPEVPPLHTNEVNKSPVYLSTSAIFVFTCTQKVPPITSPPVTSSFLPRSLLTNEILYPKSNIPQTKLKSASNVKGSLNAVINGSPGDLDARFASSYDSRTRNLK